jgi:phasin family protein
VTARLRADARRAFTRERGTCLSQFALAQERLTKNVEGISRLARCRSPQDFIAMQSELARDAMQQAVETSRRIGQVSMRVADEASGIIQTAAHAKPERARQVA